jgi:hypothetical protein
VSDLGLSDEKPENKNRENIWRSKKTRKKKIKNKKLRVFSDFFFEIVLTHSTHCARAHHLLKLLPKTTLACR